MRLQRPFCRLPIRFDADRLRAEVEALPASAWSAHPTNYAGNTAVRLITANGSANDNYVGVMKPTAALDQCPYVQQVLASFGVVWSRSRLMKLAANSQVPPHSDVNYHWHYRVRIHIPVVTFPEVQFNCGGESVHMGAGEAWIFDNWRRHSVENKSPHDRVHLVADTMGNERFWDLARRGQWENFEKPQAAPILRHQPGAAAPLLMERFNVAPVMPPAEVEALVGNICSDLGIRSEGPEAQAAVGQYVMILHAFASEWRQLWSLFGDTPEGWPHYATLRDSARGQVEAIKTTVFMRSNGVLAANALRPGLFRYVLNAVGQDDTPETEVEAWRQGASAPGRTASGRRPEIQRPLFIVSAPRSGSTLLFETLAQSHDLWTLGGEAHGLVEQFDALRPGAGQVDSNRLGASDLAPDIAEGMRQTIFRKLVNARGEMLGEVAGPVRLLEKTPKNSLRIPLFRALFPDAQFIYLWRDPRENLSSIMEAWRSSRFITYRDLPGLSEPWSLLLPPGWQQQHGRPLEEIAAFQWRTTNEIVMSDLAALPRSDWTVVNYAEFLANPEREVRRICAFAGLGFDEGLQARVSGPLPLSRHTQTAPAQNKWRKNESEILRVMPALEPVWERLKAIKP